MEENDPPDEDTDAHAIDVLLSQASKQNPCVVVVGGSATGRVFRLGGEMIVGRGAEAHIRLEDEGVSRRHLKLTVQALNEVVATDLGSTNGTYCNGQLVQTRTLRAGDRLQIGPLALLSFQYQDELGEAVQAKLYEAATRDAVTGAFNNKFLLDALEKDYAYFVRHGAPVSVIMIEVAGYEQLRAREGPVVADRVLERIAVLVNGALRSEDIFARAADDRFCAALRRTDIDEALLCAERIRTQFSLLRIDEGGRQIPATVNIGVASLSGRKYDSVDALLLAASSAVAEAHKRGVNKVFNAEALVASPAQLNAKTKERRANVRLAVPINVRMVSGAAEVEYEIRDISLGGLYLHSKAEPAHVGATVTIKLALTAGLRPVSVEAEVVRISSDDKGGVRGAALEFSPMDASRRAQLVDLLDRAMAGRGTMTRVFPRVYPLFEIDCRAATAFKAVLRDISEGGVGIAVDRKLELDKEIELDIPRAAGEPLKVNGWPVSIEPLAGHPGWLRAGIRFSRLTPETRAQLLKLLKSYYGR